MDPRTPDTEPAGRELQDLLDKIASGVLDDLADLDPAQVALLRDHLGEEELQKLIDRASGPGPEGT